ncbi:MAG TPA: M1 family metallopeptidase [Blastocatellia bacterium]|jgi:aminopeptidase N|nr:M1 family metallopeptidase [Blastocatellia bacterium]
MKRGISLLLGFCLLVSPALYGDEYTGLAAFDAIHYEIILELKETADSLKGKTRILFESREQGPKRLALDFPDLTVDRVGVDGAEAAFDRSEGRVNISLREAYKPGERFWVEVEYQGQPIDGLFIKKNKFGNRTVFADNWPDRARHWFPCIDHPSDKATVEFFVTAPAKYDLVANGALIETTNRPEGAKLTHWRESVPIPTYCMVIGAAEFSIINVGKWNDIQLSYYVYPKDRERALKDFGRALQMLEFYTSLIGPYPYEKLALVQSSTRFGGMENSSSIFFDEQAFNGTGRLEGVVAHEIAHQWFGDSVTESDWHDLWLSEGFASYFENVFFERADGRDRFVAMMLADRDRYLKAYGADPKPIYDPSIKDLFQLLNRNNYEKGGWVLHMLRRVMGDEKFFAGIRDYYRTHRDGNSSTDELRKVMEFHAGRPLDWFFRQWVFEPGYPVYDATWRWDESSRQVTLKIRQRQDRTLFRMPLDVEFDLGKTRRREVVEMKDREQTITLKLEGKPLAVALDPDEWVLKVATVAEEK